MESFFGKAKKPSRPSLVQTVTVKKVVKTSTLPHAPRPAPSSSSSRPAPGTAGYVKHLHAGKPKSKDGKSPHRDRDRDYRDREHRDREHRDRDRDRDRDAPSKPSSSSSKLSPVRQPASPARKRKLSPQRVLPPSDSESDSDTELTAKRPRFRSSLSRGDGEDEDVGRRVFCPSLTDMRGEWGRGYAGFVTCDEAVRGIVTGWAGGKDFKDPKEPKDKYQAYFPQPGFENVEPLPAVELRYPSGATEKFTLLTPLSPREFNPISELRNVIRMILKHYIPPSHAYLFGTLDASGDIESALPSRFQSPAPGALTTPPPDGASPLPHTPQEPIGDAIRRALAPNRRDGPGLVKAIERLNNALADIQRDGTLAAWLTSPDYRISRREWSDVVELCHDQAYTRVVAPFADLLEHHPKHPEEVADAISEKEDAYGELRHSFMSKVIEQTKLGPGKTFVDLGSGVGNCVVQAALQAGCASYGFELLPVPARCARLQLRECQRRWAMWCLDGSLAIDMHEGDFRRHEAVARRLAEADVVLVNNEVFPSSLNMDLTHLFLDLKEGATIVSLKPFVPDGFRMNDSNCDSFAAILRSTPHTYYSGWVSWKADSGRYYVQVVDRTRRLKYDEEMNRRGSRRN